MQHFDDNTTERLFDNLQVLDSGRFCKQNKMKLQAYQNRREEKFEVGEKVYLKALSHKFRSLATRSNEKLSPRFMVPLQKQKELVRRHTSRLQLELIRFSMCHNSRRQPLLIFQVNKFHHSWLKNGNYMCNHLPNLKIRFSHHQISTNPFFRGSCEKRVSRTLCNILLQTP